jgi:hypothetical protein
MERQHPMNPGSIQMEREQFETWVYALNRSLTAAWAHAQLLERRSRNGELPTAEQTDRGVGVIASACEDMSLTLRDLESTIGRN